MAAQVSDGANSSQGNQTAAVQERTARPAAKGVESQWSNRPYSVVEPVELNVRPAAQRVPTAKLIEPKMLPQLADDLRTTQTTPVVSANDQPSARTAASTTPMTESSAQTTASRNAVRAVPATHPSTVASRATESVKAPAQPTRGIAANDPLIRADGPTPVAAAPVPVAAVAPVRPGAADRGPLEEVWLVVSVNGQERADAALLLREKTGRLHVRAEDLQHWRLRTPHVPPLSHGGENYYPLDALPGVTYQVNESRQSLTLNAPPALFEGTVLTRATGLAIPSLPPIGGFLNYDLFATHGLGLTRGSGLLELGGFGKWGAGISSFLGREIGGDARYIRLDTTWTQDRPAELASLRLGDAINRAGAWGRPVRFGGVQWATNFATQPGFVTFPLPSLAGEAVLPSTVDLYVNDALRLRREVPSGPFSIPDLPIVTGQGEARLVVRDLLGRERIITQPYYATPRLLQKGLHDYSYELGAARRNYGIASSDYGRGLATGTHRIGFSERFTGEAHGELLADQRTLGLGAAYLWSGLGLFSGSVAASHSSRGAGGLLGAAFERQSRLITFGANTQLASEDFTQLGLQPGELAPKQISQAFASLGAGRYGSFGVNYVHQAYRDRADVQLVSGNYNVTLGKVTFGFSVLRFLNGDERTVAGLTVTLPLGERTSASAYATTQPGNQQALFQIQRNLPPGTGVGYRLLAGVGDSDRREGGVSAQNNVGTYTAEASHANGETAFRGSASGGVAVVGGKAFLSRRIADSFAVVQLPDYPNVRVYADNQLVARTRDDGSALLPRLRAYEKNSISIEQADLPLDAQIDAVQVDAVPYYRSGLVLQFPVKRSRGALITVVLDNRDPLPAGAVAQLIGEKEEFPVGMKGEIYLKGLKPANRLRVTWRGQSCELSVLFVETNDPLPDLGTYTCHGVVP